MILKYLMSALSYIIVIGYLSKIIFQMYIKNLHGEPLKFGPGNTLDIEYFKSIKLDVPLKLQFLKRIFNVIHFCVPPYIILTILYILFVV